VENRSEGSRVNEPGDKDREAEREFKDFASGRPPDRSSTGGRILRGCGIAVGIALLILAFVVGACFISMSS
jgi:hypothetical protein